MADQPQSNALQEAIEREVRFLIGDLHMKVIALHTMLGMSQQPGQAPSEPKPAPTPPPEGPKPKSNGAHEVAS